MTNAARNPTILPAPGRPAGIFLTAEWRDLVMASWEVDPSILRARVPPGTELDQWKGRAFVSLVGFRFLGTKVLGIPIPFHRDFDEVNLRFYVKRAVDGEERRGVVFIKEIVPRFWIVAVARLVYGENYVSRKMMNRAARGAESLSTGAAGCHHEYRWRDRGRWNGLEADASGSPEIPEDGSLEQFIAEHYWGYTARSRGTVEYQVEHPSWRVWNCAAAEVDCDAAGIYGASLAEPMSRPPDSVFLAEGSGVVVRKGRRLSA